MAHALFLLADAGLPMIALTFPLMLLLVVPVIVVEALLCKKWLELSTWEAMKSNALSNLTSTVIGVRLAWAMMLGLEFAAFGIFDRSDTIRNWHSPIANVIWFFFSHPPG